MDTEKITINLSDAGKAKLDQHYPGETRSRQLYLWLAEWSIQELPHVRFKRTPGLADPVKITIYISAEGQQALKKRFRKRTSTAHRVYRFLALTGIQELPKHGGARSQAGRPRKHYVSQKRREGANTPDLSTEPE